MLMTHDTNPLRLKRFSGLQRTVSSYVCALALILLLWVPSAPAQTVVLNVGLMGDSLTDEYQAPWAGAALGFDGFNWVELLHMLRGDQIGFGPFDPSPGPFNLPNGFGYNYALKGAKADGGNLGADAADAGQAPPEFTLLDELGQNLPEQAAQVAQHIIAGEVDVAVLIIGANDFNQYLRLGGSPDLSSEAFQAFQNTVLSGIGDAVQQLLDAGAAAILVGHIPPISFEPAVAQAVADTNNKITALADGRPEVAAFDAFGVGLSRLDPATAMIDLSGFMINALADADGSMLEPPPGGVMPAQCGYDNSTGAVGCPTVEYQSFGTQDDGTHPTTPIQGLMANAVLLALRDNFGIEIDPLSDAEILTASGVPVPEAAQ